MASVGSPPPAQVVGNAFVHQYYHILHHYPQLVFRFYQEGSKLSRPNLQGEMTLDIGMDAINEKIVSLDYSEFRAIIKTVDAQESLDGGVIVLVTGYLTGNDDVKKNFTQSFFLGTQYKGGYYVLNDIFRYVDESDYQQSSGALTSGDSDTLATEHEAPEQLDHQEIKVQKQKELDDQEVIGALDDVVFTIQEKPHTIELIDEIPEKSDGLIPDTTYVLEEAPKKSYASIVKVMKENPSPPLSGPVPPRPTVVNTDQQASLNPIPSPVSESASGGFNAVDSNSSQESEVVYSIYIKNLPLNATASQLEEEFKKFGPIKPGGIQVRSHKQQGFCFGFVEFEVANAVERAIEASPITIGGRQAFVEEKRPNSSRVSNKGKFLAGRGGYRNDGVIGRGNYGATRFYGRGDYGEFGHRGGGARGGFSNRRGGFGYQKVEQSGSRGNQSGSNVNWSSANPNKDL